MQKQELPELSQRLSQLADALGGKAPSPAGLLVWGDALNECRFDDVKVALSDWPKKNIKAPAPADILKVCRERVSIRIEDEARRNAEWKSARHFLRKAGKSFAPGANSGGYGTLAHRATRPRITSTTRRESTSKWTPTTQRPFCS